MSRIVIFSTAYFPLVGGAEVAVREITSRLDAEFVVITARLRPELPVLEQQGKVLVHRIGQGNWLDKIRLIVNGPRVAATYSPVTVWSIMASYAGFAALRFKKKNPTVPYLLTLQEGDSLAHIYARVWWCWPWFKQIFSKANAIQTISHYLATWATKMGGKNITVVPNGVPDFFSISSGRPRGWLREELGIARNHTLILSVSRLVPKNGLADLIVALNFLPETTVVVIAGTGPLESELRALAKQINKGPRVFFVGLVAYEKLPEYLREADIFCRPSLSEGLGNAFLEAMAAGVPVIGTPVGGIPDFLQDRKTGYLCAVRNPESIAEQVKIIMDQPEQRLQITQAAAQLVAREYTWTRIAARMAELLKVKLV